MRHNFKCKDHMGAQRRLHWVRFEKGFLYPEDEGKHISKQNRPFK